MRSLYLVSFIAGLLLAVRLMFFGAERRRPQPGAVPLQRSQPAGVAFLVMFGVAGYLLTRRGTFTAGGSVVIAVILGVVWAAFVARVAIALARVTPEHDPDDPRYLLQGHVGVVTTGVPPGGVGAVTFGEGSDRRTTAARTIDDQPIAEGVEVCIERIEDGVAFVELWSAVEARL